MGIPPYFKEFCDARKGTIDEKECFTDGSSSTRRWRTLGDHFLFVNNLADALEALMLLFAKNGDLPDTEHVFTILLLQHETG